VNKNVRICALFLVFVPFQYSISAPFHLLDYNNYSMVIYGIVNLNYTDSIWNVISVPFHLLDCNNYSMVISGIVNLNYTDSIWNVNSAYLCWMPKI
jgi:hypothetical protein